MQLQRRGRQSIDGSITRASNFGTIMESRPRILSRPSVAGLLLLLLVPLFQVVVVEAFGKGLDPNSASPCSLRDKLMDPTFEKRYGANVVWQIPPNAKASLFFAHAGGEDSLRYFDPAPKCQQCNGMPEDRVVVLEALRRGYAVIAVQSLSTGVIPEEDDVSRVVKIIQEWKIEHSLENVPMAMWGCSAGTYMGSELPLRIPLKAFIFMSGEGNIQIEKTANEQFPPTMFAYMPMDVDNPYLNVTGKHFVAMDALAERGVKVYDLQCWPKPLSPLFFAERIRCMSEDMSRKIFAAYQAAGWLTSNGYLIEDPWLNLSWESVLGEAGALPFCTASGDLCLIDQVAQELRMASARHSFTSDANDIIFPWLEATLFGGEPTFQHPSLASAL